MVMSLLPASLLFRLLNLRLSRLFSFTSFRSEAVPGRCGSGVTRGAVGGGGGGENDVVGLPKPIITGAEGTGELEPLLPDVGEGRGLDLPADPRPRLALAERLTPDRLLELRPARAIPRLFLALPKGPVLQVRLPVTLVVEALAPGPSNVRSAIEGSLSFNE